MCSAWAKVPHTQHQHDAPRQGYQASGYYKQGIGGVSIKHFISFVKVMSAKAGLVQSVMFWGLLNSTPELCERLRLGLRVKPCVSGAHSVAPNPSLTAPVERCPFSGVSPSLAAPVERQVE